MTAGLLVALRPWHIGYPVLTAVGCAGPQYPGRVSGGMLCGRAPAAQR